MFFNFFKRKKRRIDKPIELSKEDLQWNKMWDMWTTAEIESPYLELMDYIGGVNNGGHHCHLDNTYNRTDVKLKEYVDTLLSIIPEPLKSNLETAYKTYMINPDGELGDENSDILDECDTVYYNNEELLNQILRERAKKIEL